MMQNNIHVIHNTKQHFNKKNVCAYARVSSDKDLQLTSFEAQVSYYTNYILKMIIGILSVFILTRVLVVLLLTIETVLI